MTDTLSSLARKLLKLNAPHAGSRLVISPADGSPDAERDLRDAKPAHLLAGFVTNPDEAACLLAGLWLHHDHLEASHQICQAIDTPSGSLWHAILHRREGDFSNAKYWYARAARHPALAAVAANAAQLLREEPADKALLRTFTPDFSGPAFVDLVQSVHTTPTNPLHRSASLLQQLEWRTLFNWNAAKAVG
jgi:hypothetical protein